ncbi:MAG TPA: hypothetical protein VGN54_08835 [Mycobacteriales bacterium]|nr:hypothetical protein [Mycobacteriales bacterium]
MITILYAIGLILLILGVIGFFTHLVGFGIGAIIVGAVLVIVAKSVGGRGARV